MSIRTKIFFGCISLTLVTVFVGLLSRNTQIQLGDTALGIYDKAFLPMTYLRSAQSIVLSVSRDIGVGQKDDAVFVDQLQSALDALDVARERAMSKPGEACAKKLQSDIADLQARLRNMHEAQARRQFMLVEQEFDVAVGIYAGDGFRLRGTVEALVARTGFETCLAIVGSIATAFVITLLLSRAIVPSIRHAVRIATAIASGHLDNKIDRHGPYETNILLGALATMQHCIADKIAHIENLMAEQASSHAIESAVQHARFEAALDNMTLGLCMFDAREALLVKNRRFEEMFGPDADAALSPQLRPGVHQGTAAASSRSFNCVLDDGRTIAVSEEAMAGGGKVVIYEDVTERQRAEARLVHMARHDALTGLPNRVLFLEHLEEGILKARGGGVLSLLCLDLDRFKTVNDTLGHPIGDALLREAAVRLLAATPETDIVVRLGGDEFAVVLFRPERSDAVKLVAERLIDVLSHPFEIEGQHIAIGVSIGIVETIDAMETAEDLLKNADVALYIAKAEGRGTYRFFEREMDERMQDKRRLELDLRKAITEQQFQLYYQPLVNARTGAVVAFEALLRWFHPKRGPVQPSDFIPLLEETGLIPEIGLWVLSQACRDATAWPNDIKVAINLSPLQFRCRNLVDDIVAALDETGLPPNRLELEITESLMLQDNQATLTILHRLRALGVNISMDDFGSGYSSLSYLLRFPFDKIKIDRGFIQDMTEGSDGLAIVSAVISLGRSLRMDVVAEGVETRAQCNLLREAGCQELQGYLFSRPQPISAVGELIERFGSAADAPARSTAGSRRQRSLQGAA